jgi:hypothetical protein
MYATGNIGFINYLSIQSSITISSEAYSRWSRPIGTNIPIPEKGKS